MGKPTHERRKRKRDAAGQAEAFRAAQVEQQQRDAEERPKKSRNREKSWVKRGEISYAEQAAQYLVIKTIFYDLHFYS